MRSSSTISVETDRWWRSLVPSSIATDNGHWQKFTHAWVVRGPSILPDLITGELRFHFSIIGKCRIVGEWLLTAEDREKQWQQEGGHDPKGNCNRLSANHVMSILPCDGWKFCSCQLWDDAWRKHTLHIACLMTEIFHWTTVKTRIVGHNSFNEKRFTLPKSKADVVSTRAVYKTRVTFKYKHTNKIKIVSTTHFVPSQLTAPNKSTISRVRRQAWQIGLIVFVPICV